MPLALFQPGTPRLAGRPGTSVGHVQRGVRGDAARAAVVGVDVAPAQVVPHAHLIRRVSRRAFEPASVEIDDVTTLTGIVVQLIPGQRVVPVADAKKPAKAEDRVFGFPRTLSSMTS